MCYTTDVYLTHEQIQKLEGRFNTNFDFDRYTPYHAVSAFEHPTLPVITNSPNGYSFQFFDWGLIPNWCKDWNKASEIRKFTPNAKSETVLDKPSFKDAIKSNRCLIPSLGFYEWQSRGKEKVPYYIYLKNKQPFFFAGIYDSWTNPDDKKTHHTFSILTTEANPLMAEIHNIKKRMPVMLSPENEHDWLNQDVNVFESVKLLQPYDQELMATHTISPLITSKHPDKNTIKVKEPFQHGLFG